MPSMHLLKEVNQFMYLPSPATSARMWHKVTCLSEVQLVWIQFFLEWLPKKSLWTQSIQLFTNRLEEKLFYTFPKNISAK